MMMREAKVDVFCDPKRQRAAGFPVITAPLSLDMVRKAETFARVLERNLPSVENYTGIEAADRYKLGFLAEFAFANVLKHAGRAFVYQPRLDGVSDNGTDFRVAVNQVTHSIDVKTASRSHHRYLMVPDAMWRKHGGSSDFYIGARLDLDELACELWGVATWLDVARARRVRPLGLRGRWRALRRRCAAAGGRRWRHTGTGSCSIYGRRKSATRCSR